MGASEAKKELDLLEAIDEVLDSSSKDKRFADETLSVQKMELSEEFQDLIRDALCAEPVISKFLAKSSSLDATGEYPDLTAWWSVSMGALRFVMARPRRRSGWTLALFSLDLEDAHESAGSIADEMWEWIGMMGVQRVTTKTRRELISVIRAALSSSIDH